MQSHLVGKAPSSLPACVPAETYHNEILLRRWEGQVAMLEIAGVGRVLLREVMNGGSGHNYRRVGISASWQCSKYGAISKYDVGIQVLVPEMATQSDKCGMHRRVQGPGTRYVCVMSLYITIKNPTRLGD